MIFEQVQYAAVCRQYTSHCCCYCVVVRTTLIVVPDRKHVTAQLTALVPLYHMLTTTTTTNQYYCSLLSAMYNSSLVSASELQKFNVSVWKDKLRTDTADSKLNVLTTGAEGLVRWTGTPLKINGLNSKGRPDGVFITGDLVNGKAGV
jgi:hypothetical protein